MTFKSACICQSEMPSWRLLISLTPLPCHHAIFLRWHSLAACLCVWNAGWLPALRHCTPVAGFTCTDLPDYWHSSCLLNMVVTLSLCAHLMIGH